MRYEVHESNGFASSASHELLWAWVDDDRSLTCEDEAIRMLCTLQSIVSHSGVTSFPQSAADCVCADRPYRGPSWRNDGDAIRYIARAVRDAIGRDQLAREVHGGH